ncbi:flippase [Thermococcus sp.]|uniref:flippase n=1 Tax=Thermococcus sp. TaxID=35749 RepID=UPI00262673E8|nr:flippase [Thermococcus sp.]
MSEEITGELGRVARGGVLAFMGLISSALFGFLVRAVIGRYLGPDVYGTYSLAMTVFTITLVVVMMGFPMGLQRQVAYFLHRKKKEVPLLISTAIHLVGVSSIIGLLALEATRGMLPRYIGGGNLLVVLLGVLALALPLTATFNVLISTTQGFGRVREYLIYGKISAPALYFLTALVAVLLTSNVKYVAVAYLLSYIILLSLLGRDARRFGILPRKFRFSAEIARELLLFSLPLMTSNLMSFIMNWTDTLMLGHYLGERIVGLYNAAGPITRFIPVFMASLTVIYTPVVTGLFSRGRLGEVGRFYTVVTKWVVLLTFPLFVLVTAYPVPVLRVLFGSTYTPAWEAMVILAFGFMFHSIVGPNGLTLVTIGKPSENMKGDLAGAILNVVLNYFLIPAYGMTGAAVATASSYIAANVYKSLRLAQFGIVPFGRAYLKVLTAGIPSLGIAYLMRADSITIALLGTGLSSLVFYALSIVAGALEEEDIKLLKMAGEKFGLRTEPLIRFLERFGRVEK